jgi:hypothetical protein
MHLNKTFAALVSCATLLAILWPVKENWQEQPKDNFPLSYFPMFSYKRDSVMSLNYLVGYDTLGTRCVIPYRFAGSGGFNQVRRQINKKVRNDKGDKLVAKVAKRLQGCDEAAFSQLCRVELVEGTYNFNQYFIEGNKTPLSERCIAKHKIEKP